jgi:hypothetical protein
VACLVVLLAAVAPRVTLVLLWLFSDLVGRAFESWIPPVLGFLLLPYTTVAWVLVYQPVRDGPTTGGWIVVVLGVLIDVSSWVRSGRFRRSQG